MSPQKQQYQAYMAATQTVAKTKQIVLLYDGAIRFMQQAKEAIREKRIEDRYHLLVKTSDIISGLQACLDFENGGDIARLLYGFYASIDTRLFAIHRNNNLTACDDVINELKQMRDVWASIDQGTAEVVAAPAAPAAETEAKAPEQTITLSA